MQDYLHCWLVKGTLKWNKQTSIHHDTLIRLDENEADACIYEDLIHLGLSHVFQAQSLSYDHDGNTKIYMYSPVSVVNYLNLTLLCMKLSASLRAKLLIMLLCQI